MKPQIEGRKRDLAVFNLAIDSKLRGSNVVRIKVEDVAPRRLIARRCAKGTAHPVKFELTEHTRQAIDDFMKVAHKQPGEYLFTGRRGPGLNLTTRQYARLVSEWIASIGA